VCEEIKTVVMMVKRKKIVYPGAQQPADLAKTLNCFMPTTFMNLNYFRFLTHRWRHHQ
jgi:hypothetical protein